MHADLYVQFATIIGCATIFGIILHLLKQPLVAAYLLAGVLLSFFHLIAIPIYSPLTVLPTIGVAFLLFLIGMELDLQEIKSMGISIVLASILQTAVMTAVIAVITSWLGFSSAQAILTGLALSFSSTIVVIKLLLDKHETASLHGRVALGILLSQDIIAIFVLMFLSFVGHAAGSGHIALLPLLSFFGKGIVLFGVVFLIGAVVINRFFRLVASNLELLFLSAISWCFIFIVLAVSLGFSLEIGAFLAGLSLASSPYRFQIAGRLKPLRDFFIAIFFVTLGQGVLFTDLADNFRLILFFSIIALVLKPLLFMAILSILRFKRFTVFQASTAMSQVSEFSILIFYAAQQYGFVDHRLLASIAMTTIITIFVSAILINQNHQIYPLVRRLLNMLPIRRSNQHPTEAGKHRTQHIILIGAHQLKEPVLQYLLEKAKDRLIVVDDNPKLGEELAKHGVVTLFGDIADPDILEQLDLATAQLIISLIRNKKDVLTLLQSIRRSDSHAVVIAAAETDEEAVVLYKNGADEVIVPSHLEGLHVINLLAHHWHNLAGIKDNQRKPEIIDKGLRYVSV